MLEEKVLLSRVKHKKRSVTLCDSVHVPKIMMTRARAAAAAAADGDDDARVRWAAAVLMVNTAESCYHVTPLDLAKIRGFDAVQSIKQSINNSIIYCEYSTCKLFYYCTYVCPQYKLSIR